MSWLVTATPAWVFHPLCVLSAFPRPPPPQNDFMHPGLSCCGSGTSLPWEGKKPLGYYNWPGCLPMSPQLPQSLAPDLGTFLPAYKTSLSPVLKHPLHILASKIYIGWDSVGCSLRFSEVWLSITVGRWQIVPPAEQVGSAPTYIATVFFLPYNQGTQFK